MALDPNVKAAMQARYTSYGNDITYCDADGNNPVAAFAAACRQDLQLVCVLAGDTLLT